MIDSVSDEGGAGPDLRRAKGSRQVAGAPGDRLPPYSAEAERGVLGCCLLSARDCLTETASRCKGQYTAFYDQRHQAIFTALLELQNKGVPIDLLTVQQHLKDCDLLDKVGGIPYLSALQDAVPSAANLEAYLTILFEKWVLRRMVMTCTEAVAQIYAHEGEVTQLVTEVQNSILTLPTPFEGGPRPLKHWVSEIEDALNHYRRGHGLITGLRTGYRYLDRWCAGMNAKNVWFIGGDPGSGKTTLAMNIAERMTVDMGIAVGVQSLEMGGRDLILRLACSRTRVNFHKLRTGFGEKEEIDLIQGTLPHLMNSKEVPLYIDDSGGLTVHELRSRLRMQKHRYGIQMGIVDYMQLISLTKEQMYLGPAAGYGDVARVLQQTAKELDIPLLILSQLNNEGRKRNKTTKPQMTDFRETGAISDVADFAGILWRPALVKEEETRLREAVAADPMGKHLLKVHLEVLKNKNGPAGSALMFDFLRWCMRFEDGSENESGNLPLKPAPETPAESQTHEQAKPATGEPGQTERDGTAGGA